MNENNRKVRMEIYTIPFIIVTLITIITVTIMSRNIKSYYYDLKREEAIKISRNISSNLSHSGLAEVTINTLLDKKLTGFLITIEAQKESYSNDFLAELGKKIELDEIYSYNSEGKIIYSSSGRYIGWQATEGNPVYEFMMGDEDILIEDIRKDTESETYYKYGYIRNEDGSFLQIGILADKVFKLLESFRLQNQLIDMTKDSDLYELSALDNDYVITASTKEELIGTSITDEDKTNHLNNNDVYDQIINKDGIDLYNILIPIEVENRRVMAFEICYSLNSMQPIIKTNIITVVAGVIVVYLSLIYSIITAYRRSQKLIQLAYYDTLTGLPNAESLNQKLEKERISNKNKNKALIMVKCDNLNLINLTFGYRSGDIVLKELGNRMRAIESNYIKLFKLTSDKYVFHIDHYEDRGQILSFIESLNALLEKPFLINDIKEYAFVKLGVVEYKEKQISLDRLLQDSTIALNFIDNFEGNNYIFFNETMESVIQRSEIIESELREAINEKDRSKIYLHYQPIIDAKTHKVDGFEALARMNSKQFGRISPSEFIDIAEKEQLIIPLSKLILNEAGIFMSKLIKQGFGHLYVAVNISTIHVLQDDFTNNIFNAIDETGIEGRNLELEITETIFMNNFEKVNEKLSKLRSRGVGISLDDFGTGYSSFDRLSELNVDTLKIDRSFISKIDNTDKDFLITRDIISLAHRLGLKTVAEGVELEIQKDYLLEYDCDKFQGYLYSKPVSEVEAIDLLKEYNK